MQELEELDSKGDIILYYADESHVCTNGYVPYGWQYKDEDVYVPAEKAARLNIFGMITRRNEYKGFTTHESINADKVVEYLDLMSFSVKKKTALRCAKRRGIMPLCRQAGLRVVPPQRRTEAEVMRMTNVDLLNVLLAVAGLVLSAYALGLQNRR